MAIEPPVAPPSPLQPETHAPVVGPERSLPEITLKAVLLGIVLAMMMAAANAYLGLKVAMTVAASIPASAIALGVLRAFRRSNILENNQVQTIASAGASTVSGIIFTVPALVMMGAWERYDYWPIFLLVVVGGVMGVVFTTPLRRALIVDVGLTFPEGVATAEVLKTGGVERDADAAEPPSRAGSVGFRLLLQASVLGGLFKLCEQGLQFLRGGVATTQALFGGRWLFKADATLAPSLLGIGFIVGPNIGALMLSGGVLGTLIGVPINWLVHHDQLVSAAHEAVLAEGKIWEKLSEADHIAAYGSASWEEVRRIGIGCMLVGGVWSLITLAKPMVNGIRSSLAAFRAGRAGTSGGAARTELDTPIPFLGITAAVMTVPLFLAFHWVLGDYANATAIAAVLTVLMLVFGFLFCSVAGYMAGLVGSSNNPVSGVTMATVVVSALLLHWLMGSDGVAGRVGPPAVIFLAAFICTAACIAGDNLQDLKCGHVVGATPWKQQVCLVIGSLASAAVIPFILQILDRGYGIGRPGENMPADATPLAAPQATLMKDLATGIFGVGIDWTFIAIGCGLAVLLIVLDRYLENRKASFRTPVLAVAVGIYLPLGLSVLIFVGGVLSWLVARRYAPKDHADRTALENAGMLLASGLITGEAIIGVVIAIWIGAGLQQPAPLPFGGTLALLATFGLIVYLYRRTMTAARQMHG